MAPSISQGYPDFQPPTELLASVTRHLEAGHNQYAPMPGIPALRQALTTLIRTNYGAVVDPDTEVTITSGATIGIFSTIVRVFVHPGDEVICFDPAYDSYEPAIRLAGGKAVRIPMLPPNFAIDWNRVREAITSRTAMIIINSPHNPTGAVLTATDISALRDIVSNTSILLLSDEVYEHIIFDGRRHESLLRDPELAARSVVDALSAKPYI